MIILGSWGLYSLDQTIQERLEKRLFEPPIEFYSAAKTWSISEIVTRHTLNKELLLRQAKKTDDDTLILTKGKYSWLTTSTCQEYEADFAELDISHCLLARPQKADRYLVAFDTNDKILAIRGGEAFTEQEQFLLSPLLFAQYYQDRPILRQVIELNQAPTQCLKSVLAIEDPQFLTHSGVSLRGTLRAIVKNVLLGDRSAGGGSTITQQLMKNFFLSSQKTYRRKVIEIGMALVFEFRVPKDKILEAYLNVIYMGQSGPFAVHGFAAASQHYFKKDLEALNLPQCALLAAILNSPGRYNPFRHPDSARQRRTRVLDKMLELGWIDQSEYGQANSHPLPQEAPAPAMTAPYFVDAVRREISDLGLSLDGGARIHTTMVPEAQKAAQKAVREGLDALENWFASLKERRQKGEELQGLLIAANPKTGHIESLVGGRDFRSAPYNRALRAHRQVGSLIKPFVYLTALESFDSNGEPFTPLTLLSDEKFTHEYQGQSWSPKNYSEAYRGSIPMFYALKNSINAATAKLGLEIGLTSIIDVTRRMGIESKIEALPAMTLGAYELYAIEVLRAYTTIARFGSLIPLSTIESIENLQGETIYKFEPRPEQVASMGSVASLVSMLKQTVHSGTAKAVGKIGFTAPAAGKTGTTSDTKDAWFSGFTPHHVAVVWVGYDQNQEHGLTGATAAVPIWTRYMMDYAKKFPATDFVWPQEAIPSIISEKQQLFLGVPDPEGDIELYFRAGTEP